jgi:5'-nucleotidase (lipoprotein e(P4) family)
MAALYNYYADEYAALCYQAYNLATERVDDIRAGNPDADKLAIVVDIDETLLDNSPHQALMIKTDSTYPYMWREWCDMAEARPVPGAVEFLQYADEKGFNIFYVSNRKVAGEQEGSMENLSKLGFPQVSQENFLLKTGTSDKQPRRDEITGRGYEIVLLVGDNLGDFYTDEDDQPIRREQMASYRAEFGKRFIVLPNPMYGNWPGSIGIQDAASMDSLLLQMTKSFK